MAQELITHMGEVIESITLITGDKGVFDVSANGDLIFSKKQAGHFPELRDVWDLLQSKLPSNLSPS